MNYGEGTRLRGSEPTQADDRGRSQSAGLDEINTPTGSGLVKRFRPVRSRSVAGCGKQDRKPALLFAEPLRYPECKCRRREILASVGCGGYARRP